MKLAIAFLLVAAPTMGAPCESLSTFTQPHVSVTLAQTVAAGQFTPPARGGRGASAFANLPAFCRVAATLTPTSDSDIKIEVWLPAPRGLPTVAEGEGGWNGKLEAVGNGAWAGTVSYPAMATALSAGYATVSTDTGHVGGNASFMVGHPEKLVDFEERAVHEMTVTAKAIAAAYYGSAPQRSYFNGCSTGGRQALTEAQRYPLDFDAIVAGAPANFAKRQTFGQVWLWQATHKDDASLLTPEKFAVLHKAVVEQCDALDGVKDGVLENPTKCRFDPGVVLCKGNDDLKNVGPDCLTAAQVEAARKIYAGASHANTHERLYPGLEPGSELGWNMSVAARPVGYAEDFFKYIVFKDEKWDPKTLNYDVDVMTTDKTPTGLNAVDANLNRFVDHGGKLLVYHGWSDPGIPPSNSVHYYQSVLKALGTTKRARDGVRLFMVPGMAHCGGGDGTSSFDMVAAVDTWVATKMAPSTIPASKTGGTVSRTRPLCAYPAVATYKGTGSTDEAANFVCR
jgi:tannase/feruloyl esterase